MRVSLKIVSQFIMMLSLFGLSYSTVLAGTMGPIKNSNWYLGVIGSALWADLPSSITANNGAPSPYNNDYYTLSNGTEGSVALTLGHEWNNNNYWFPAYALGVQYEHFFLGTTTGDITQYGLPSMLNYSYDWNTSADLLSIYTKINLLQYERFSPFIKAGIGWAMNRSSTVNETAYPGITPRIPPGFDEHTQNELAYNLGVGVDYDLSQQWSASLAYNYQDLGSLRSSNGVTTWAGEYLNIKNYQINMLSLGVTYHLD